MAGTEEFVSLTRADGRVELMCLHGVGHPSHELTEVPWESWMGIHGCDGCCDTTAFTAAEGQAKLRRALQGGQVL